MQCYVCIYVCMYVGCSGSYEHRLAGPAAREPARRPYHMARCVCMYACMHVCMHRLYTLEYMYGMYVLDSETLKLFGHSTELICMAMSHCGTYIASGAKARDPATARILLWTNVCMYVCMYLYLAI